MFETLCKFVDMWRMKKVRSAQGAPAPSVVVSDTMGQVRLLWVLWVGRSYVLLPESFNDSSAFCPQADGVTALGSGASL